MIYEQQEPLLLLDVSTPQGAELHLDVSTLPRFVLHLDLSSLQNPGSSRIDSEESIPPGWESIPGLLKRFTNTGSACEPHSVNSDLSEKTFAS